MALPTHFAPPKNNFRRGAHGHDKTIVVFMLFLCFQRLIANMVSFSDDIGVLSGLEMITILGSRAVDPIADEDDSGLELVLTVSCITVVYMYSLY